MPRPRKPPRLWLRPARADREATWAILDGGRETSTGCSERDLAGAERELARYLARKYEAPKVDGQLDRIPIATVLNVYLKEHVPTTKRPDVLRYCTRSLRDWWCVREPLMLSDIREKTCNDYKDWRVKKGVSEQTARHDLTTLESAISYYHGSYGPLKAIPVVAKPPLKATRQNYYLERKQVADRIRAARRLEKCKHVIRCLLIGVYTGTRPGATKRLRWVPSTADGWFDLDNEVLHRRGDDVAETNKRQPPARIHRRLLPWLRRWYKADMIEGVACQRVVDGKRVKLRQEVSYVIHYGRKPVKKLRRSWNSVRIEAKQTRPDGEHIMRHTAATWQMRSGVNVVEASGYLGMSVKTLLETYGHHHPDFQESAAKATGKRR